MRSAISRISDAWWSISLSGLKSQSLSRRWPGHILLYEKSWAAWKSARDCWRISDERSGRAVRLADQNDTSGVSQREERDVRMEAISAARALKSANGRVDFSWRSWVARKPRRAVSLNVEV